jgi:beta-mannosidase
VWSGMTWRWSFGGPTWKADGLYTFHLSPATTWSAARLRFPPAGFRMWNGCRAKAPVEADPWVCVVNGRPIFLQGVNFPRSSRTSPTCAGRITNTLTTVRQPGVNTFRINARQFLEREWFYDLCDELGLLVWQEFPITRQVSRTGPGRPCRHPRDGRNRPILHRASHTHASLILWSGSN